jgi:hypothetical protein
MARKSPWSNPPQATMAAISVRLYEEDGSRGGAFRCTFFADDVDNINEAGRLLCESLAESSNGEFIEERDLASVVAYYTRESEQTRDHVQLSYLVRYVGLRMGGFGLATLRAGGEVWIVFAGEYVELGVVESVEACSATQS